MIGLSALTLVPYLSNWDPLSQRLSVDLMCVPLGDPRQPLTLNWPLPPGPMFEGQALKIRPHISSNATVLPTLADVPPSAPLELPAPASQAAIFAELAARYDLAAAPEPPARNGSRTFRKYLPQSYRKAFGFVAPRTELAVVDDSYHCARRCPPAQQASDVPWSKTISWGDIYAMLLRQPSVARAAGLIRRAEIDVGDRYDNGGWLFLSLSDPWAAQAAIDPRFVRLFATRVPKLAGPRPVFTAVLFPVGKDATEAATFGPMDEVYPEAVAFDDGFTKIVHASQARTSDHAEDGIDEHQPPLRDMGVRLGWDDESIVERLDRTVSATRSDGTPLPMAPTGAAGYRIDVRNAGESQWSSLTQVQSPGLAIGTARLEPFTTELMVEIHPSQIGVDFWVPPYFTYWTGGSLVADTDEQNDIEADPNPSPVLPLNADAVPLRYGRSYEFRVRMVDAVGGGPRIDEAPIAPAQAPVAALKFKRYVPLAAPRLVLDDPHTPTSCRINRPAIGYPQAELAGAINARSRLAAQARNNRLSGKAEPLGIPDPDADFVEIRVLVRMPAFDPSGEHGGFRELYRTTRKMLALDGNGDEPGATEIELQYIDCARVDAIAWPNSAAPLGSETGPLVLPSERDVRIELRALARHDDEYFGTDRARRGDRVDLTLRPIRKRAIDELMLAPQDALLAATSPQERLASVYLRADMAMVNPSQAAVVDAAAGAALTARLAQSVDLVADDGILLAPQGQRFVFACRGLKHVIAPDASSVQISAPGELPGRWINVLKLEVQRDWTWLGAGEPTFEIVRKLRLKGSSTPVVQADLGSVTLQHTIGYQARRGEVDRSRFWLCLIDAVEPLLGSDGFPYPIEIEYDVRVRLANGQSTAVSVSNELPITIAPNQVPRIVATGHAFSDYRVLGDYEETQARERVLWIEFAEPLADARDAYFARVLHSTPDPMLLPQCEPMADPAMTVERPLDPEWVRVVRPGQVRDLAGLMAFQKLIPCETQGSEKPRHYMLRQPPSLSSGSPELLGFFSYEFAVGHDRGPADDPLWVTAQARFGVGLTLEGVQHPAPPLTLEVEHDRKAKLITLYSEFARATQDGRELAPKQPNTEIWMVMYARVMQADGKSWRNLQIGRRRAFAPKPSVGKPSKTRRASTAAISHFKSSEVEALLDQWGLPAGVPLGFVAIELLPEPNGRFADPVGADLGHVRILRTSRLVAAGGGCC